MEKIRKLTIRLTESESALFESLAKELNEATLNKAFVSLLNNYRQKKDLAFSLQADVSAMSRHLEKLELELAEYRRYFEFQARLIAPFRG